MMEFARLLVIFFVLLITNESQAGFRLIPENPLDGQNIYLHYIGCDPVYENIATNELFYIDQEDNLINVVVSLGSGLPLCPFIFEYTYDLGSFPSGNYQIDVYTVLATIAFPIPIDQWQGTDSFNVIISKPEEVPALNSLNLLALSVVILLVTRRLRIREGR